MEHLHWLPTHPDFDGAFKLLKVEDDVKKKFAKLKYLSQHNIDLSQILRLDKVLQTLLSSDFGEVPKVKLAVLASFTYEPILPSLRIACLRRGLIVETYLAGYNQYRQELFDKNSNLFTFKPDLVLFALHRNDVLPEMEISTSQEIIDDRLAEICEELKSFWKISRDLGADVIQQTLVNTSDRIFGHLDKKMPGARAGLVEEFNRRLMKAAQDHRVVTLDLDDLASSVGKNEWNDPRWWYHAKQFVTSQFAGLYGDHVARIVAAMRGLSAKCLIMDLDNTLWGGLVGEDGMEGISIGPGDAVGESYSDLQAYAKKLKERGVVLAVSSKNEEANARMPFEKHPEMVLRLNDIASFHANWRDKAINIKEIAKELNLGLEAFVFFDDNPAERALIRELLPEVSVPEVPDDPALYVSCLAAAGYFESVEFTQDDLNRASHYQGEIARENLKHAEHDINSFLTNLNMVMSASPFKENDVPRIAQLINKSNQFNLTTRRYSESQVRGFLNGKNITLQVRLKDRFGDNGLISVLIAMPDVANPKIIEIDTWLMSCRVLGREVEHEVLNLLATIAREKGVTLIKGRYLPTPKNNLVKNHYKSLGFSPVKLKDAQGLEGGDEWELSLSSYSPHVTKIFTEWNI